MATKIRAEQPFTFNERDFGRAAKAIQFVESFVRGPPQQRARWPIGDSIPGNRFGKLKTALAACTLTPVMVLEYTLEFDAAGVPTARAAVLDSDGKQVEFPVVETHGQMLPAGRWVSCIYWTGGIWTPVAAHCTGSCAVSMPAMPCPDPQPMCPGTQVSVCVDGQWVCQDMPPDCTDPQPPCPAPQVAVCVDGQWICQDMPPVECDPLTENCPVGTAAICVNGEWVCVPTGGGLFASAGGPAGGSFAPSTSFTGAQPGVFAESFTGSGTDAFGNPIGGSTGGLFAKQVGPAIDKCVVNCQTLYDIALRLCCPTSLDPVERAQCLVDFEDANLLELIICKEGCRNGIPPRGDPFRCLNFPVPTTTI